MAAAVVLTSHEAADRLGVPADRRVYLRGWSYATDPVYLAEHPDPATSPAMHAASADALRRAGVRIDDVAHLDLYSCFGSSIRFALDALGLSPDDSRGVTVTGGLPFAGGPGSGYMLHSIATMVDVLRDGPGSLGLVSGVGMHMTKHVYAVYGTTPSSIGEPDRHLQARLDTTPPRAIRDTHDGHATVATYTVAHARATGVPASGPGDLRPSRRRPVLRAGRRRRCAGGDGARGVGRHRGDPRVRRTGRQPRPGLTPPTTQRQGSSSIGSTGLPSRSYPTRRRGLRLVARVISLPSRS
ncbi:MAG: hypothetical protein U5R31_01375 [Acidimicrobiia bacterium]|nr:hypothetical protein [Acidimicrobiia bacterium]